jgi:hypothetical protein
MRRRAADWVIGAGLLVSLAANAHLVKRWRARPAAAPMAASPVAPPGTDASAGRALAASWRQALPGVRRKAAAGEGTPVRLDRCELHRAALTAELAGLEQVRQVRLPPAQRFAEAPANPTLTTAFSTALAAELAKEGLDGRGHGAECHDRLCRLTLPNSANKTANQSEWLGRLASSEWMGENLHEVARDGAGVLYAQHTPGAVRSSDLLQQAVQDFEGSGAIEACQRQFGGDGTLDAQVTLAPSEEGASSGEAAEIVTGGRLAGTSLGTCIDAEFRKSLQQKTLPPHFEHASLLAQFPKR